MAVNIPGLVAIAFFYLVILIVGIWAGRKGGEKQKDSQSVTIGQQSNIMLAGRNIGLFVGVFTMTATWVGGGYINGTAEVVYVSGLAWCQAPFGYALSLAIGGNLFAVKMRNAGYKTMLDPFQQHFGARMGGLLFLPALCGEVFWSAAILAALGATVEVIVDLGRRDSVIASACIALFYTFTGGLYSVAYTDVVQLVAIFFGLWLCLPFAMFHGAVGVVSYPTNDFIGTVEWKDFGIYWDAMLLLMMGGIPWQVYFQRVLSSRTAEGAELLSYMAALGCLFMAIPPVVIGAVAKAANLTAAGYTKPVPLEGEATSLTLPLVLQYLTPPFVSAMGLGAVSAAVMSSSDSSILSAASMFAWNIYRLTLRQQASDSEVIWVMRCSIVVVGALATYMALAAKSVYSLWFLSSDLVYVILFPQLLCVVYLKDYVNTYGSLAAYVVGCLLRAGGGEDVLGIPAFIRYPYYDEELQLQRFPFRTFAMCSCFATLVLVSVATNWLLPASLDVFGCFVSTAGRSSDLTSGQGGALSSGSRSRFTQSGTKSGSADVLSGGGAPRSAEKPSSASDEGARARDRRGSRGSRSSRGSRASGRKGARRGSSESGSSRRHKKSTHEDSTTSSPDAQRERRRRQSSPDSS
ncbi:high-affinity choline transporter 1-like [Amblyomma americanum]